MSVKDAATDPVPVLWVQKAHSLLLLGARRSWAGLAVVKGSDSGHGRTWLQLLPHFLAVELGESLQPVGFSVFSSVRWAQGPVPTAFEVTTCIVWLVACHRVSPGETITSPYFSYIPVPGTGSGNPTAMEATQQEERTAAP